MSAVFVEVPAAIVTVLNGEDFAAYIADLAITDEWTAARSYGQFKEELKDAGNLRLDVLGVTHTRTALADRSAVTFDTTVDVAVRKKFGPSDSESATGLVKVAEVDRLIGLVERIYTFFAKPANRELPDADGSAWVDGNILLLYHRKHLDELRQFTGAIRLKYHTNREL